MKKFTFAFTMILFMALLLGSCSSDSNDAATPNSSLLIGKWKLVEVSTPDEYEPCDFEGWSNFKTDGKFADYDACDGTTSNGSYTVNGNSLTFTPDIFPIPVTLIIKTLTNSVLVVDAPDFEGGTMELKFIKI